MAAASTLDVRAGDGRHGDIDDRDGRGMQVIGSAMRRLLIIWSIAIVAALVVLAAPSDAEAAAPLPVTHVGWVRYSPLGAYTCRMHGGEMTSGGFISLPGSSCGYDAAPSGLAYRWTGSAWQATRLPRGYVYVYPYASTWRWAWTAATGWVAVYDVVDPTNANNAFHPLVIGPSR